MRKLIVVAAIPLFAGCVSTVPVSLDRSTAEGNTVTVSGLNSRLAGCEVVVHMAGGERRDAVYQRSTEDSCWFLQSEAVTATALPTTLIRSIEQKDHLRGAASGFLSGFAVGAGAGLLWSITGAIAHEQMWPGKREGFGSVALGGLFGGIGGLVVGAVKGERRMYEVTPDTTAATSRGGLQEKYLSPFSPSPVNHDSI